LEGFKWIEPHKGQFWADPFLIEHENKTWMFFEDFSYRESRAWISCAEISADGGLISPVRCLDNPNCHYSYPHVFRSGSDLFMVPEARDSRSVDLYRCLEFPSKWVLERTLLHGKFVDTTTVGGVISGKRATGRRESDTAPAIVMMIARTVDRIG